MILRLIKKLSARPLLWNTITTTGWSTVGKAAGFLIPFFIAAWYGANNQTDAFFFVYILVIYLANIFNANFESVIVPYIAEIKKKNENVEEFIASLLGGVTLIFFIISLILLFFIGIILKIATKFDSQTLTLIHSLLIELIPFIFLLFWSSIMIGVLNAFKKFSFPAFSPGIRAIIILLIMFLCKNIIGIKAVALGYITGELIRVIFFIFILRYKNIFRMRLIFHLTDKTKSFMKTALFQSLGAMLIGLNPIIDEFMASWLGKGSVSILYYANRLYFIPLTFITAGLMVVLLSHWSEQFYKDSIGFFEKTLKKKIIQISIGTLIIVIVLVFFNKIIVNILFSKKFLSENVLTEIRVTWLCYLVGLVPYIISLIFVRIFLILKDTKSLMICAFYMMFLNIFFNYILMQYWGTAGLSFSTSLISVFPLLYLGLKLKRRLYGIS